MVQLALFALFAPVAMFLAIAVLPPLRRRGVLAGALSSTVAVASLGAGIAALLRYDGQPVERTVTWLVHHGRPIASVGVFLDGVSLSMMVVVGLVAAGVQVYSLGYLHGEPEPHIGRYFAWQSLFIFSMQSMVVAPNLLQLFAGWELVGLCSYLLIGYYWTKPSAAKAAVKAFWVTKFADMGLMAGIIVLFVETGSFDWQPGLAAPVATAVAAGLFIGVMGKSAQVPLHIWLPDAMEGPTPVSALLHAATMVAAGVYLIVRAYPIFEAAPGVLAFMAWLGAITAFVAAVTAIAQDDIKKVLAYSTCSQLGYMVAALGSGHAMGGYFHLTTHAFFKALLFLGAGAAIHAVHSNDIHDMGGLLKKMPWSSGLFLVGTLALIGFPGTAGFFSKDFLLEELLEAGQLVPLALLVVSAGLTAFYMTRVFSIAYLGDPSPAAEHAHGTPATMFTPMAVLGVLALGAGYFGARLAELWGFEYAFHLSALGLATTGLGLLGIALGWLKYARGVDVVPSLTGLRAFIRSGPVDTFWDRAWRRGLLPTARGIGWFDRYVVDGLINLVAWATLRGSEALRKLQTGRAVDYVYAVVVGLVIFAAYGTIAR